MSDIVQKYSLLNREGKKEVVLLIDKLLQEQKQKPVGGEISYMDKIMTVSQWSEEDIEDLINSRKRIQNWDIQEW